LLPIFLASSSLDFVVAIYDGCLEVSDDRSPPSRLPHYLLVVGEEAEEDSSAANDMRSIFITSGNGLLAHGEMQDAAEEKQEKIKRNSIFYLFFSFVAFQLLQRFFILQNRLRFEQFSTCIFFSFYFFQE